jgi:hypothetical protein
MHNYKLLRYPLESAEEASASASSSTSSRYTRFDELLLEMVDLVRDRWGFVETEQFGLTGYSGGAQVGHYHNIASKDRQELTIVRSSSLLLPSVPSRIPVSWSAGSSYPSFNLTTMASRDLRYQDRLWSRCRYP